MKIISFITFLLLSINTQFLYAQKDKCILKKITIAVNYGIIDSIFTKNLSFSFKYEDGRIAQILQKYENNIDYIPEMGAIFTFFKGENSNARFVVNEKKDTLYRFDYNSRKQLIGAQNHGFKNNYFVCLYDDAGRITAFFNQNIITKKIDNKNTKYFKYDNKQEASFIYRQTLMASDEEGRQFKGRITFDDKINPFEEHLELYILFHFGLLENFMPNNQLAIYTIENDNLYKGFEKITNKYQYNKGNYPIFCERYKFSEKYEIWSFEYENCK